MMRHSHGSLPTAVLQLALLGTFLLMFAGAAASAAEKPKVRTITAFLRLEPGQLQQQVVETVTMLRGAVAAFERAGYPVQSIRISTQPFPEYTRGMARPDILDLFRRLDELARQEGFTASIGPAMLTDGDDPAQAELLAQVLASTSRLFGSIVVGSDTVHWKAVRAVSGVIKYLEENTLQSLGNFRFAALSNVPAYTPFYPASFHQGMGRQFSVALESANVVAEVMAVRRDEQTTRNALIAELGMHARAVEAAALQIDRETGWTYMGLDLSPAPMMEASIASATAGFTGGRFGTSGTLTATATITAALRGIAVQKVGFSGVMMPVLEDKRLAQLWAEGALSMDQLLAYSAVCGTGLDTVPLPGEVTIDQLDRIIGDVATLSVKLGKPLTARLMPVARAVPGDLTVFDDPNLVNTAIQPLP